MIVKPTAHRMTRGVDDTGDGYMLDQHPQTPFLTPNILHRSGWAKKNKSDQSAFVFGAGYRTGCGGGVKVPGGWRLEAEE